ncbi:CD3072 family TudS-related putative desulfidase [Bacteroidota bacterium]
MERRHFIKKGIACVSCVSMAGAVASCNVKTSEKETEEFIPEFEDARSKKVMIVAHCILNQNARINTCAYTPSAIEPVVLELLKRKIGIIQMPCPETQILGLARRGNIYEQLSKPGARKELREYSDQIIEIIQQNRKWNFKVCGVLGIDGSPCCGVDLYYNEGEKPGTGAFMEELKPLLAKCNPAVKIRGIQDAKVEEAVELVKNWDES